MKISVIDFFVPYDLYETISFGVYYGDDYWYTFGVDIELKQIFICCWDYDYDSDYCKAINIQYNEKEFENVLEKIDNIDLAEESIFYFSDEVVSQTLKKHLEGVF